MRQSAAPRETEKIGQSGPTWGPNSVVWMIEIHIEYVDSYVSAAVGRQSAMVANGMGRMTCMYATTCMCAGRTYVYECKT